MNNTHKKYKRPKQRTLSTTKPESSRQRNNEIREESPESLCPLAAKDSEWVDILQTPNSESEKSSSNLTDEEEVLQLVECEEGPQMKPLAIMFPGLLDKDPRTLQGMLNKAMSTTEVTKHLVDLGQKANFTFMKQADRLIPRDKQWLESLTENSNSYTSMASGFYSGSISSDYEADNEATLGNDFHSNRIKKLIERRNQADARRINPDDLSTCMQQIISEVIQLCGNNEIKICNGASARPDIQKEPKE